MNRKDAKLIAKTITFEQMFKMLDNAKKLTTNWRETSRVNMAMTKGTAWNMLARPFMTNNDVDEYSKYYLIYEFGDYLPDDLKIKKVKKVNYTIPHHQEPIFDENNL